MTTAIGPRFVWACAAGMVVAAGTLITLAIETLDVEPAAAEPTLVLVGNAAFTTAEIRAGLAGESPLADATGAIDPDAVEREVLLILAFYWDHGHANVKVGTPAIIQATNTIELTIDEGPRFTLGDVVVTGGAPGDRALVHAQAGMLFSRTLLATDRERLATYYEDRSYAFANVLPQTHVDLARRTVDVTFEIERGVPARFERIDLDNASHATDAEIRRVITVAAGEPYTSSGLTQTKRQIAALGLAVDVSIKTGSRADQVVATIEVNP